jgi:hypothetical protein
MSTNQIELPGQVIPEMAVNQQQPPFTEPTATAESLEDVLQRAKAALAQFNSYADTANTAMQMAVEREKRAADLCSALEARLTEATTTATAINAIKTQVTGDQAVVAAKSEHIEGAQQHADKVRSSMDRALTAANQQAVEAEGIRARAQATTDAIEALQAEARTSKEAADSAAEEIVEARDAGNKAAEALKGLAEKARNVDAKLGEYETRLATLNTQCEQQLKNITDLLPGATSAGLAHAFDARRKTFLEPSRRWQWIFVGSVLALVALAGTGLFLSQQATYDDLLRLWLARLPVAGALIWLAIHSSRESALAKRLEEDYGYKATIAASFLGFNNQMSEIAESAGPDTPLARLCNDTLTTIGNPPGRIYDKHGLIVTPTDELKDAVTKAAAAAKEAGK